MQNRDDSSLTAPHEEHTRTFVSPDGCGIDTSLCARLLPQPVQNLSSSSFHRPQIMQCFIINPLFSVPSSCTCRSKTNLNATSVYRRTNTQRVSKTPIRDCDTPPSQVPSLEPARFKRHTTPSRHHRYTHTVSLSLSSGEQPATIWGRSIHDEWPGGFLCTAHNAVCTKKTTTRRTRAIVAGCA